MPKPKRVSVVRPVQPGTRILNAVPRTLGTIGLILHAPDGSRWVLSCLHVIGRPPGWNGLPAADGEPIYQPKDDDPANSIALSSLIRSLPAFDAAAARVHDPIACTNSILDLGAPTIPVTAVVGMAVIKSGSRTGVTRGVVSAVSADRIEIVPAPGETGSLTKKGDSGAVWLEEHTLAPVAMHLEGNVGGGERSVAAPIMPVLAGLGLTLDAAAVNPITPLDPGG